MLATWAGWHAVASGSQSVVGVGMGTGLGGRVYHPTSPRRTRASLGGGEMQMKSTREPGISELPLRLVAPPSQGRYPGLPGPGRGREEGGDEASGRDAPLWGRGRVWKMCVCVTGFWDECSTSKRGEECARKREGIANGLCRSLSHPHPHPHTRADKARSRRGGATVGNAFSLRNQRPRFWSQFRLPRAARPGACICPSAEWVPSYRFPGRRWDLRAGTSAKEVFPPGKRRRRLPSRVPEARGPSDGAPSGTQAHSAGENGGLDSVPRNSSTPRAGALAGFSLWVLAPPVCEKWANKRDLKFHCEDTGLVWLPWWSGV